MSENKKVEQLRDIILKEIKAGLYGLDVICWDKGCRLAITSKELNDFSPESITAMPEKDIF